jgi:hypothetical protein
MPKVHNIGKQHFIQYIELPVKWGRRLAVRGWTQEIEEPFRTTDNALIVRLPFYRALVVGKWTGYKTEEQALEKAIEGRVLTDEDFEEGWTAPAVKAGEADFDYWNY